MAKKTQLESFLQERRADAELMARRPGVWQLLGGGGAIRLGGLGPGLLIKQAREIYGYHDARLIDRQFHTVLATGDDHIHAIELAAFKAAVETRKPALADMHLFGDGKIGFGLASPVFSGGDTSKPVVGVVYLEMEARSSLYPLISEWPEHTESAETLLLGRQGKEVIYLSPLKFAPTLAPLSVRRSMDDVGLIGAKEFATGQATIVSGKDYRDVAVVGAAVPIAGTGWLVAAKIDHDEVAKPLNFLGRLLLLATALVALLLAIAGRLLWRAKYEESVAARARLDARYAAARRASIDAYLVYDESARIIDVNDAMLRMTGYTRDELVGKTIKAVNAALTLDQIRQKIQDIRRLGEDRLRTRWRCKDGSILDVEVKATYVPDPSGDTFHAFVHDIGPELVAYRRVERLNALNLFLNHVNAAIFHLHTAEEILAAVCEGAVRDGGFVLAWAGVLDEAAGRVWPIAAHGAAADYAKQLVITTDPALPTSHGPTRMSMVEQRIYYTDDFQSDSRTAAWHELARAYGLNSSAAVPVIVMGNSIATLNFYSSEKNYFDPELRALLEEAARNVSLALQAVASEQAKQAAEAAQQASEELFARAFDASPMPMQIVSLSSRTQKFINKAHERTFGYSLAEIPDEASWFATLYA